MVVNSSIVQQQVPHYEQTQHENGSSTVQDSTNIQSSSSNSKRSSPCRLFIQSINLEQCVICGFHESDHLIGSKISDNSNGSNSNGTNSYDVRGEYLSKEDFRAKYANYLKSSDLGQRRFYYHPSTPGCSVYYYTDKGSTRGQNGFDSGGDTDVEQQQQHSKTSIQPNYWSDSESTRPYEPLITFRPIASGKSNVSQRHSTVSLSLLNPFSSTTMFTTKQEEKPEIPPRRSLPDYKDPTTATPVQKPKKRSTTASTGVKFQMEPAIIGDDGGAEHFSDINDSSDVGGSTIAEENGDIADSDEKSDFERMTELNTEFNANRKNFEEKSINEAVLVSVTIRPPPPVQNSNSTLSLANDERAKVEVGITEPPVVDPKLDQPSTAAICVRQPMQKATNQVDHESTAEEIKPVYAPITKPTRPEPLITKKSRLTSELDEKLQRMARDLDACRLNGPNNSKSKAPAPPPPKLDGQSTSSNNNGRVSGFLKKSYSAFVVPTPSPLVLNSSATDLMTCSVTGPGLIGTDLDQILDRSLSHERCSSVDISSVNTSEDSHAAAMAKANEQRQSRSRFASIRKFLRISEPHVVMANSSVRRTHHDSSSTNCSTISCSSSSNGSISFGNNNPGGFHSSLRKFPLPSFGIKHRTDLNTVRGLFHGANECRAVDEIAQDTDVVVTEINELPSANNTLVRASRRACHFGPPDETATKKQGTTTNGGYECSNGTKSQANHDNDNDDGPSRRLYINRLEVNGKEHSSTAASLPPRPPPNPVGKVKRIAPSAPIAVNGEEKVIESAKESAEKATETTVWHLATTVAVQTSPNPDIPKATSASMPPISASVSRSSTPASITTDTCKRTTYDDRYDQLVAGHLSALSQLVEHFPSTTRQCRRKLINLGVDPGKLKWTDFNVVANSPLLVTETSAFYAGILKLENKPENQSLKVDLMITPLRYNNAIPTPVNQHRSFFPPVVAEFQEYIPSKLIKLTRDEEEEEAENEDEDSNTCRDGEQWTMCKILVLPRMMVSNMESYADHTSTRHRPQKQPCLHEKEACFIMIQLVTALKYLQSKGVEEIDADLDGFLLFRTPASRYPQLVLCCESFSNERASNSEEEKRRFRITLCQGALAALCQLLHTEIPTEELIRDGQSPNFVRMTPYSDGFQKAAEILHAEKPHSLTNAKSILEYMFWVDGDRQYATNCEKPFENEQHAKWWLDRERAKFVCYSMRSLLYFPVDGISENANGSPPSNSVITKLDIVDEYKSQFLLHATAKSLIDASAALEYASDSGEILL